MNHTLNDAQLLVLRWVAAGADLKHPPNDTFKTSAVALHTRGLVNLDKRRGRWSIEITDAGKFYLEHGFHPKAGPPKPTPKAKPAASTLSPKRTHRAAVTSAAPAGLQDASDLKAEPRQTIHRETLPIPDQLRRPHRAVKEIVDHKARLGIPVEQHSRALLILHALAQEAIRRGWEVIPNPSTFEVDRWNGRRKRVSPGPDLFSIDAGAAPAALRFRVQHKRVDHVPTEKELAEQAKYSWSRPPKHDYLPTDRLRLDLRSGSSNSLTLDDTASTPIEDKLLRAVEKIEQLTVHARELAEQQRQMEIQRQLERERAEQLRKRAARYSSWYDTLEQLRADFVRHRELTEVVARLRLATAERGPEHEFAEILGAYLSWSEEHLEESDPLRRIPLPQGDRPDMTFDEWQDWMRHNSRSW